MQSLLTPDGATSTASHPHTEVVPGGMDEEDESQFPPILSPDDDPRTWDIGRTNQYVGRCRFWHVVRVLHHPTNKTDWMVYVPKADMTAVHMRMHYDDPAEAARVADIVWRRYMKQQRASQADILRKTNFPTDFQLRKLQKHRQQEDTPASLTSLIEAPMSAGTHESEPPRKRARMEMDEFTNSTLLPSVPKFSTPAIPIPGDVLMAYARDGGFSSATSSNAYSAALATADALGFTQSGPVNADLSTSCSVKVLDTLRIARSLGSLTAEQRMAIITAAETEMTHLHASQLHPRRAAADADEPVLQAEHQKQAQSLLESACAAISDVKLHLQTFPSSSIPENITHALDSAFSGCQQLRSSIYASESSPSRSQLLLLLGNVHAALSRIAVALAP